MKIKKYRKELFIVLIIFATTSLLMLTARFGNDFFWHLKSGEYMIRNHLILRTDVFSWYLKSFHPLWISHEWLFEVLLYQSSLFLGDATGVVWIFLSFLLLFFILFFTNRKKMLQNIYYTFFWFLASIIFVLNTTPRPFLVSNIFLAITFYLLYDLKENENSKKIYILPLFAILWANIHGGSSNLSYILIFVFYFCSHFEFNKGKVIAKEGTKLQKRKYLFAFFLTIFAICINPHTWRMLLYPYQNMHDIYMISTISEWRSLSLNDTSSLVYLFLLVISFIPLLFSSKKIDLTDFILICMFVFLGFKSVRFCPLSYIAFTYIVFNYVGKKNFSSVFSTAMAVFSCILILISIGSFQLPKKEKVDSQFIQILKEEKPKRLYNSYDYGGYLIYFDIPVFIDGRADLYSQYNYQDYYNLSYLNGNYLSILNKYKFDYFLVEKGYPITYYLKNNDHYEVLLERGKTILFKTKEKSDSFALNYLMNLK